MNVDDVKKKEENLDMNTDLFSICDGNADEMERLKEEEKRQERNDNMAFVLTLTYVAGLLTSLAIFDACHLIGLV